jgi:hypothetical protein
MAINLDSPILPLTLNNRACIEWHNNGNLIVLDSLAIYLLQTSIFENGKQQKQLIFT